MTNNYAAHCKNARPENQTNTNVSQNPSTSSDVTGLSVALNAVSKIFDSNVIAVEPISLYITPGDFIALLGPSGCGKSTLLRMIAGLEKPTAGHIHFNQPRTPGDVSFVFQDAHLLPWRNVLSNVTLPLELLKDKSPAQKDRAAEVLKQVGLAGLEKRYPAQLSGGQRMRVSLARALMTSPQLLLLDEPFAALDEITRQQLDEMLRTLWHLSRMTVVFVTHSIIEATYLAERAIVFSRRPGRVVLNHLLADHLPMDRSSELRTTVDFASQMKTLFTALAVGEHGTP
jgi:NitT/TauT family transport system ATP-binding protein